METPLARPGLSQRGNRRLTADPALPRAEYEILSARQAGPVRTGYGGAAAAAASAAGTAAAVTVHEPAWLCTAAGRLAALPLRAAGRVLAIPDGHAAAAVSHAAAVLTWIDLSATAVTVPAGCAVLAAVLLRSAARERSRRRAARILPRRAVARAARRNPAAVIDPAALDEDLRPLLEAVQEKGDGVRSLRAARDGILPADQVRELAAVEWQIAADLATVTGLRAELRAGSGDPEQRRRAARAESGALAAARSHARDLALLAAQAGAADRAYARHDDVPGPDACAADTRAEQLVLDLEAARATRPGRAAVLAGLSESVDAVREVFPGTAAPAPGEASRGNGRPRAR